MKWNYRVVRRKLPEGDLYAIHEVYYDEDGSPKLVTEEPSYPMGESYGEFQEDFEHYLDALNRDLLNYEEF